MLQPAGNGSVSISAQSWRMTSDGIGRALRALRHTRNWTQSALAARAGCSRSVVSRVERGNLRACSLRTLHRLFESLDASLILSVRWRGGELDRLLDADHALLGERWPAVRGGRWQARAEVTYSEYGERGSIDELAFDAVTGTLLVTELKTGIYEANRATAKLDEKARLAASIARRLGWEATRVVPCFVFADTRTNRRRVEAHAGLFGRFECRGRGARAWLRDPAERVGGLLLFVPLSDVRGMHGRRAGRQRVRATRPSGA
jgi:transcriptional regulator with XRE-family HTH domain